MFDFVHNPASADINQSVPNLVNQSAPNLVTVYMTNRSQISLIIDIIRPEHLEVFALELEKIAEFNFVYTLASTNIDQ